MKKLAVLAVTAAVLLSGCSATPYHKGFNDSQLTPTRYQVHARVSGSSTRDRADDIAMLRAAELACINNYRNFDILESRNLDSQNVSHRFITIELSNNGEYDSDFLIKSMQQKLNTNVKCHF